jgi:hypothetical protein
MVETKLHPATGNIYRPGDVAPPDWAGRPFVRMLVDAVIDDAPKVDIGEERQEEPAPNRMAKPAKNRKARR